MSFLFDSISQSQLFNYACVPLLLVQSSLLHPVYQTDPFARAIRLILLPLIITLAILTQSRKLFVPLDEYLHLNYGLVAVPTFHICCLAVQFAFHQGPVFRLDDKLTQPDSSSQQKTNHQPTPPSSDQAPISLIERESQSKTSPTVFELINFSLAMVTSPRGLRYTWAPPPSCLRPVARKSRLEFLRDQLKEIAEKHVLFLLVCAYMLPATHHPGGPEGWMTDVFNLRQESSRPLLRIFANSLTAFIYTLSAIWAFSILGALVNILELCFNSFARFILPNELRPEPFDTSLYPPIFNHLGSRDTLADFWGKGWQCVFRRDFVFCGGTPMGKIGTFFFGPKANRPFAVMGSMIFSGIFHEWGILTITTPDMKFNTTKFFIIQGVGILIDRSLNVKTSLRGRKWRLVRYALTYSWLLFTSQAMFESLFERGLGKSGIIASDFRHWHWFQFVLPFGPFIPRGLIYNVA